MEILHQPITNTAMFGALVAISGIVSLEAAKISISLSMAPKLVEKNQMVVEKAYYLFKQGASL
ncbi:2-oxoacid:acceptor oxidoreductase family protein [Megasphaera paucivorans]